MRKRATAIKRIEDTKVSMDVKSILSILDWMKEYSKNVSLVLSQLKFILLAMGADTDILGLRVSSEAETAGFVGVKTSVYYQGKELYGRYIKVSPDGEFENSPEDAANRIRIDLYGLLASRVAPAVIDSKR